MGNVNKPIHVYFMPGMAAGSSIFENVKLPASEFDVHHLEWEIPEADESLKEYSKRMAKYVHHEDIVLIGVSFGGVIVQEMSKILKVKRVIIISSIKCNDELPSRMKFASKTGLFKILPTSLVSYVDHFDKFAFGSFLKTRAKLYKQYISITDKQYLDWAIREMLTWDCEKADDQVVHIHGDKDEVFPIKNIKNAIIVKDGTHIMIVNRFRWFNENLPNLIKTGKITKEIKTI
ncbi:alpha/beta hydrolase [Christiangramia aquimixticola]|uniref:alpha/beta hydrolase n=1 Tax=Christiangramia aquimixticola TaxID=1697558 RepID=UPI003AA7E612